MGTFYSDDTHTPKKVHYLYPILQSSNEAECFHTKSQITCTCSLQTQLMLSQAASLEDRLLDFTQLPLEFLLNLLFLLKDCDHV